MKLKIQLQHPGAKAPTYATDGAACFDLYAATVDRTGSIGAMLLPIPRCEFETVEQLTLTERGAGGFGSTGAA